jgi:hypothetical protein
VKTADFYVGLGDDAEWIGSLGDLGTPSHQDRFGLFGPPVTGDAYTEASFRDIVGSIVGAAIEDGYGWDASYGWPWGHPDSNGTDYAYAYVNGTIHVFEKGFNAQENVHGAFLITLHYPNATRKPGRFPTMGVKK